ncbi:MAG: aldo/keto reductase [Treponema sp.]|jgi:predicted aldo/keto reductase-like oxidoreductase|nr:aldo/keto reductase [Treponema sp.]
MQYRIDKRSGNKLSVLGLGCMRFPGMFGRADLNKTEEMIMRAVEKGVNYFDTAWMYPGSEETLGVILDRNNAREKIYIATKLPLILCKTASDFDKYFNQSLERLKTQTVDYYLMHSMTDAQQWAKLKSWGIEEWIHSKKKSGQIKQAGFSFHGSADEFLKILDDYGWECCLIQLNYSDENFQAGIRGLRAAAQKMPVMIMEPLLGGKLATGLPKGAVKIFKNAGASGRSTADLSPAGWALNWVWNHEEVTLLLSGMSNMEQLEENIRLADASAAGMLGETEKAVYSDVLKFIRRACKIGCTGCNYCMPCPKGVNIPGCFSSYNTMHSLGFVAGMQQFITSTGLTSETGSGPGLCVKCGKCESHCPQKIPIMKELATVRRRMEPWWIKLIGVCARAFFGTKRKK